MHWTATDDLIEV